MTIESKITISPELQLKISKLHAVMEPDKLAGAVGAAQRAWVNKNFEQGGIEQPWPPLSEFTLEMRQHGGSKPLNDTGKLKQSFDYKVINGGKAVVVGSNIKYAEFHESGTGPIVPKTAKMLAIPGPNGVVFLKGTKGIPQRKMLPSVQLGGEIAVKVIVQLIKRALGRG